MNDTRYRVRDRNTEQQQGTIWGEDLSEKDAQLLKEQVVGAGKSRTARVEPMSADPDVIGEPQVSLQHARDIGYVVNHHQPVVHPPPVQRARNLARPPAERPPEPFKTGMRPVLDLNAPELVAAREAAKRAAAPIAQQAQAAHQNLVAAQAPAEAPAPDPLPAFDDHDLDDLDGEAPDVSLDELQIDTPEDAAGTP